MITIIAIGHECQENEVAGRGSGMRAGGTGERVSSNDFAVASGQVGRGGRTEGFRDAGAQDGSTAQRESCPQNRRPVACGYPS